MEAIFTVLAKNGRPIPVNEKDFRDYMLENEGEKIILSCKIESKTSEKLRMYAFLFGPLMEVAVKGFVHAGYFGIDRVAARYKLQAEFCKKDLYNEKTKTVEVTLEDISGMTKARLLQFIVDCVFYIEGELGQRIPDSAEYKAMKGDGFMSVKHKKNGE